MTTSRAGSWRAKVGEITPELIKNMTSLREMVLTEGALSLKIKTLMIMLCDALLGHPDGVANLAKRARDLGASEAEIAETLEVAFMMGGIPGLMAGANAFRDKAGEA